MARATYQIEDEPSPGALARIVVQPLWPFLALMLAGAWLAWPWFALNSFAMGSPTRRKELGLTLLGLVAPVVVLLAFASIFDFQAAQDRTRTRLLMLPVIVVKLAVGYVLYLLQARTFAIYRYYGGVARSGLAVLLIGAFLLHDQVDRLVGNPLLKLVLGLVP